MSFLKRLSCCTRSNRPYKLPDMLPEDAGITTPLLSHSPKTLVNDKVKQVFSELGQYIQDNEGVQLRFRAEDGQTILSTACFKRVIAGSSKTLSLKLMTTTPSPISNGLTGTMNLELRSSNLQVTFLLQKHETDQKGRIQNYRGNPCTAALPHHPEQNPEANCWTLDLDRNLTVFSTKTKKPQVPPIQARWIDFLPPAPPSTEDDEENWQVVKLTDSHS